MRDVTLVSRPGMTRHEHFRIGQAGLLKGQGEVTEQEQYDSHQLRFFLLSTPDRRSCLTERDTKIPSLTLLRRSRLLFRRSLNTFLPGLGGVCSFDFSNLTGGVPPITISTAASSCVYYLIGTAVPILKPLLRRRERGDLQGGDKTGP